MTLKANELRIGNYLNGKQGHVIITEIRENNIVKIHDNTSSFYVGTCLKPITLTEEWLIKFGFEWNGNKFLTIFTPCGKAFVYLEDNFFKFVNVTIEIPIKYVHQLQNLYFALTGEELKLKNNSNN